MEAHGVGEHGAQGGVVDVGLAVVGGAGVAQVGFQALLVGQRQHMHGIEVVLVVILVEVAVVVAGGQLIVPLVAGAGEVELIAPQSATRQAGKAAGLRAAIGDGHDLMVRGVTLVDAAELAGIDGHAGDIQRIDLAALEALRQQTRIVGHHYRQLGHQGAGLEYGL